MSKMKLRVEENVSIKPSVAVRGHVYRAVCQDTREEFLVLAVMASPTRLTLIDIPSGNRVWDGPLDRLDLYPVESAILEVVK